MFFVFIPKTGLTKEPSGGYTLAIPARSWKIIILKEGVGTMRMQHLTISTFGYSAFVSSPDACPPSFGPLLRRSRRF